MIVARGARYAQLGSESTFYMNVYWKHVYRPFTLCSFCMKWKHKKDAMTKISIHFQLKTGTYI